MPMAEKDWYRRASDAGHIPKALHLGDVLECQFEDEQSIDQNQDASILSLAHIYSRVHASIAGNLLSGPNVAIAVPIGMELLPGDGRSRSPL